MLSNIQHRIINQSIPFFAHSQSLTHSKIQTVVLTPPLTIFLCSYCKYRTIHRALLTFRSTILHNNPNKHTRQNRSKHPCFHTLQLELRVRYSHVGHLPCQDCDSWKSLQQHANKRVRRAKVCLRYCATINNGPPFYVKKFEMVQFM